MKHSRLGVLTCALLGAPLEASAESPPSQAKTRIVPAFREGRAIGFKLFSIQPGSAYRAFGLENGDIVRFVNGFDLTAPDKALRLYTALSSAGRIFLEVERAGRALEIETTLPSQWTTLVARALPLQ